MGSYGYTIAASMAKIVEQALGGEYTVTVQPYASPTVAMKAVMNGEGELAYTADIGMSQFHERVGGFKDDQPTKPEIVHTWYAYPMESLMATMAGADKYKCWKDFSGKPVFYRRPASELARFQRIFRRSTAFKHVRSISSRTPTRWKPAPSSDSVAYTTSGSSLSSGRRPRSAWTSG